MRVAYFSESLPPLRDGVARTLSHLVEHLESRDVPYRFVSGTMPHPGLSWRDRVFPVASARFPLYDYYRVAWPLGQGIDRFLDAFGPDLVHAVNPTPLGVYGIHYARRRGIPVVASYHTRFTAYLPYYRLGSLQRAAWAALGWFHRQCAATYAPSRAAAAELERNGVPRVRLWRRGIDTDRFHPRHRTPALRREAGAGEEPLVLYVGRLVREKCVADLLQAGSLLRDRGVRFRLVLVGDGPARAELQAMAPWAHFTGFRVGEELARWYASADVFAFPSTTETFGNVILEAFASGLPVVAVSEGGVTDLVEPGRNGSLAEPRDPASIAATLEPLLRDPLLRGRLAEGALRSAGRYCWTEVHRGLLADYARVVSEAPARPPLPVALETA